MLFDSPAPKAIEAALGAHKGTAMINSISLEKQRFEPLIKLVAGTDHKVIALCISDEGMPRTVEERMSIADKLINGLVQRGVKIENIYVDPLLQALATDGGFGAVFLDALERLKRNFNGIHVACGLSNISFGLPNREFMNHVFMIMAMTKGLDAAIANPLDKQVMAGIITAEALAGRDPFCLKYLKAYRNKKLEW